ncbi:hypothetical protein [Streptomyces ardesiacus]|uniref:hypothetical protein n=1 Tax=Streptomyces ardesiacus TaxID=285564 RepID=UPI0036B147D2
MAKAEPIRKSSLPTTPPSEYEFHTVHGGQPDSPGVLLIPDDDSGPVVVRRRVTYGDWEPVRPDHWADEAAPAQVVTGASAPYPDYNEWLVQMLLDDGIWGTWCVGPDRDKARERIRARRAENPNETFRLVRMTTVHTVEDDA